MTNKKKVYSLTKLIEFVGEDKDAIQNMTSIFLSSSIELLEQMDAFEKQGDSVSLAKAAHKLKPSLSIFGLDHLIDTVKTLETNAKENKGGAYIKPLLNELHEGLNVAFEQMRQDFPDLP